MKPRELPPPFYDSQEEYMVEKRGRPARYVTIEQFNKFVSNDFEHLRLTVNLIKKLTWGIVAILGALLVGLIIEFIAR